MIITCGQCQAKFKVAPEQIKETGSKVRCSNCQHVFTVYRPKAEPAAPSPASTFTPVGTGLAGGGYGGFDEGLDSYLEVDDDRAVSAAEEGLTPKERRELRRQLYSDLAGEEAGPDDSEEDDLYAGLEGDDDRLPPLRRSARPPAPDQPGGPDQYDDYDDEDDNYSAGTDYDGAGRPAPNYGLSSDDPYEEEGSDDYDDYDDEEPAEDYPAEDDFDPDYDDEAPDYDPEEQPEDDDPTPRGPGVSFARRDHLGLSANPVGGAPVIDDADYNPRGFSPGFGVGEAHTVRAAVESSPRKPLRIIIPLALMVVALGLAIYFFSRPGPSALSGGEAVTAEPGQSEARDERSQDDPHGTANITFAQNSQNYFYRTNKEAGQILIITGKVKNNYPEVRSFIQLRGHLLSESNETLADRFVYAGNFLSEDDLANMTMKEISTQLNIKAGRDRRNINVPPGGELPFMIVFDKLPDGMNSYRIEPVGSSGAQQ